MPTVFIMIGLPGSGKSYARENIVSKKFDVKLFVSSDWYIEQWANNSNKQYNEIFQDSISDAIKEMNKDVDFLIVNNISFIWDQTNLTKKKRAAIMGKIPDHYMKVAVYIDVPLDIALERNASRERQLNHSIIENMAKTIEFPSFDEGFDRIATIDISGNYKDVEK